MRHGKHGNTLQTCTYCRLTTGHPCTIAIVMPGYGRIIINMLIHTCLSISFS